MDNNEFEKETVVSGTDVTPDITETAEAAEEIISAVESEAAEAAAPEATPEKEEKPKAHKIELYDENGNYTGNWKQMTNIRKNVPSQRNYSSSTYSTYNWQQQNKQKIQNNYNN